MRVAVIGGGFGAIASAVRVSKLGHDVTLVERSTTLGGALQQVSVDGFTWDAGPSMTLLPAVIRDLFRKSGRPLEREVDLEPLGLIREHRFTDDTVLRLPGGSRAAQIAAFDELGATLGSSWVSYVEGYGDAWEMLRRDYFEQPWDPKFAPSELNDLLTSREMLHTRLRKVFQDERLRLVAAHPFIADGHDLRRVPAWMGLTSWLEQRFGAWTVPGGMAAIGQALIERLATRNVSVLLGTEALDIAVRDGRAVGVRTSAGELDTDAVICAIDPRRLPLLAPLVRRTLPTLPPAISHVGLDREFHDVPHELVLHGDPTLTVRTGGTAPDGCAAWTIHSRGQLTEGTLHTLARHRLDLRGSIVTRVDRSPSELVETWGGSPLGVRWRGRATVRDRLGPHTPVTGVYAAGAHATPGSGLAFVGLSAALVAQAIGPA